MSGDSADRVEKAGAGELPPSLIEHAERLLLSTGLTASDALQIATGEQDPPEGMEPIATALRAGWAVDTGNVCQSQAS